MASRSSMIIFAAVGLSPTNAVFHEHAISGDLSADKAFPSFASFVETRERKYQAGNEYEMRRALYEQRVEAARQHNSKLIRRWTAGVSDHADWTEEEVNGLHGWRNMNHYSAGPLGAPISMLEQSSSEVPGEEFNSSKRELADSTSWTHLKTAQTIRNQKSCGSCWAVTTSTLLENYHEIYQKHVRSFSAQEMVSCTPNPQECGGKGGCHGATVELAMDYAWKNGLKTEAEMPYKAITGTCDSNANAFLQVGRHAGPADKSQYAGRLQFGMSGWKQLEENKLMPVLEALHRHGPVGASVAAKTWHNYKGGIFDGCSKDVVLGHAVMLMGYGKDPASGDKYWRIQNSWGGDWGDAGYISLLRTDEEEKYCGVDKEPSKGTGCKGGPASVPVCGMCGILYDNSIPLFDESGH